MIKRRVAAVVFYDDKRFLLQNRKKISKIGEEYSFFGGGIEEGETPEQALKREMREELGIEIKAEFFKHEIIFIKERTGEVEKFVYIAKIPEINKLNVQEGEIALVKFEDSFKLKMVPGDVELLKEIYRKIKK